MKPAISIIVPVYNAEKTLTNCIDSILAQTQTDFELILINDGSLDASGTICEKYMQENRNIIVQHQKNAGVSAARNLGLRIAQGTYISFVDADDTLDESFLERQFLAISPAFDLVLGGYTLIKNDGTVEVSDSLDKEITLTRENTITELLKPSICGYQGFVWNKLFRREVIETNTIRFSEKIAYNEDRLFIANYVCHMNKPALQIVNHGYFYRENTEGAMFQTKITYTPRYISDFWAFREIHKLIIRHFHGRDIKSMSSSAVVGSYSRVLFMMRRHNKYIQSTHIRLFFLLLISVGPCYILREKVRGHKTHNPNE